MIFLHVRGDEIKVFVCAHLLSTDSSLMSARNPARTRKRNSNREEETLTENGCESTVDKEWRFQI